MDWELDKKRPICPQICEKLCIIIATGELKCGDRLMSVRDVALTAGVTPNTVQKSFEQLEQQGVIYSRRGAGWYVTEKKDLADRMLNEIILKKARAFIGDMRKLRLDDETIISIVKEYLHE